MARRSGKRVEVFEIHTKLRPISVEIRLEKKTGLFFSEFAGERLENPRLAALRETVRAHVIAHANASFTFKPFIEYRLLDDRKATVVGLEYRTIELTEPEYGKARLVRPFRAQVELDAPQYPVSFVETVRYFPKNGTRLVPFTPERLRVFEDISRAVQQLRERLHGFLDVPEDVIGDSLDWLSVTKLPRALPAMSDLPASVAGES